jgi:hypothetical protein
MAESHPFSNAGLGMFGTAERKYAQEGMQGGDSQGGIVGDFLGSLIGLSPKGKDKKDDPASPQPTGSIPPLPKYEPQTAFPDILQQQYVTPYQPGAGGAAMPPPTTSLQGFMTQPYRMPPAPAPADPMAGFKTQNPFSIQPQATASGYHPATDALWGKK